MMVGRLPAPLPAGRGLTRSDQWVGPVSAFHRSRPPKPITPGGAEGWLLPRAHTFHRASIRREHRQPKWSGNRLHLASSLDSSCVLLQLLQLRMSRKLCTLKRRRRLWGALLVPAGSLVAAGTFRGCVPPLPDSPPLAGAGNASVAGVVNFGDHPAGKRGRYSVPAGYGHDC